VQKAGSVPGPFWKGAENLVFTGIIIIRSNCLKVVKAMNLLKSNSKLAPCPAINIVNPETNNKITFNQ